MPEKQFYTTSVSKEASLATFQDIRENEQAIQPFTQTPSSGQPGAGGKEGLCAHDLFYLYTARIIKEKTVFTR
jgi:hypothetical protein